MDNDESLDELVNAFMKSFEEYDDDDDSIIFHENKPTPEITNPMTKMVNNVLLEKAKYNKSFAAASAHSNSLNCVPGAKLKIPTEKQKMKRQANLVFKYEIHIFCDTCKLLFQEGSCCERCGKRTRKSKCNYFIYIPILQQIMHSLDRNLDSIVRLCARNVLKMNFPIFLIQMCIRQRNQSTLIKVIYFYHCQSI